MLRNHLNYLAFLCLFLPILVTAQNTEGVTITTSDGEFAYCFPDTLIEIKIDVPEGSGEIDEFRLKWCASCDPISIPGSSNPPNQTNRYTLSELFEQNCSYQSSCLEEGICFTVSLLARFEDGTSDNNSFDIFFRFPPRPAFNFPNSVCTGQMINFQDATCPTGDSSMELLYDYGDGSPVDDLAMHTYQDTGTYRVTLMASNFCGENNLTRTIRVLGTPEPAINLNPENGGRDTICVGDVFTLDGEVSRFVTDYQWSISPSSGFRFEEDTGSRDPAPKISFTSGGNFTINLRGDNSCRVPGETSIEVVVIEAPILQLDEQVDACLSFNYSPSPLNDDAIYLVNGMEQGSFPLELVPSSTPYTIEARISNECGPQVRFDTFFVNQPVPVNIVNPVGDTSVCVGSEGIGLAIEGIEENAGTWQIDGLPFTPPFIPDTPGDFQIVFETNGSGECQTMDVVNISVEGLNVQAEDVTICEGATTFQLEASPGQGRWNSTDCPTCVDTLGRFDPLRMGDATAVTATYTISSAIGCSASRTITVSIDQPLADFSIPASVCAGENIDPDFSGSVGSSFVWLIDQQMNQGPPFNLVGGQHEITLIVGTGVCADTSSRMIDVIAPAPAARIQADQVSGCSPLTINFNAGGNLDSEANYLWSFNRSLNDTLTSNAPGAIEFINNTDTTIVFEVNLSVGNTCTGTDDQVLIEVLPSPKARIGTAFDEYCSGDTIIIINASKGLPDSYTWIRPNGSPVDGPDLEPQVFFADSARTESIMLIARNTCNVDTFIKALTILPTDVVPAFNLDRRALCVGDTLQITSFANTPRVNYEISDGNFYSIEDPFHIFESPGEFSIIQRAFACGFDSTILNIRVNPEITAAFTHPGQSCPEMMVPFNNLSTNAVMNEWRINGQLVSNLAEPNLVFDTLGDYTIELTVESVDGCKARFSSEIEIINPPDANFTVRDSVCAGALIEISYTPLGSNSYVWLIDNEIVDDGVTPQLRVEDGGIHTVTQVVTNQVGCTNAMSQTLFVRSNPTADFRYSFDFECTPTTLQLTDLSQGATSWEWTFPDGTVSTEQNPSFTAQEGGDIPILLEVGQQGFCFDQILQTITINPTPKPVWSLLDERCKAGDEVILMIENEEEHFIEVSGMNSSFFVSGRNRFELVDPGDYLVSVTSQANCDTNFVVNVPEFQSFFAEITTPDTAIIIGEKVQIKTFINQTDVDFFWFPKNWMEDTSAIEPIVRPLRDVSYIFEAHYGSCISLDTINVAVLGNSQVFIPNAFSPNGDGTNDRFKIFLGPGIEMVNSVEVYSRWGELVYREPDRPMSPKDFIGQIGWDGTFKGRLMNPALFVYKVDVLFVGNVRKVYHGEIQLIH